MSYTVHLYGKDWGDEQTNEMCTLVDVGQLVPDEVISWTLAAGHRCTLVYDTLSEAQATADELWEVYWATRHSDVYADDNVKEAFQFVAAVFASTDERLEFPMYTRGYYASYHAPWNFWMRVTRPRAACTCHPHPQGTQSSCPVHGIR